MLEIYIYITAQKKLMIDRILIIGANLEGKYDLYTIYFCYIYSGLNLYIFACVQTRTRTTITFSSFFFVVLFASFNFLFY